MRRLALLGLLFLALPAAALDKVALQLNWKHQFQFAGYYAAIEQGYYRDAGFDVRLLEADGKTDPIDIVLKGKAAFGVGASELALRRAQGDPVVALATILQHSPLVLLARQDSSIETIQDLAAKRIMLMPHETELYAYLKREGVAAFQALPHSFDAGDLVAGKTDALSGYVTDEPFALQQAKFPYHVFTPRSSGIDFYGDTLFTTDALLRSRPERVAAFREASLRGWRYAMQHPEEIADLILAKYSSRHSRAHLLFEAREMARLMQADLVDIGHMLPGRWQHIAETYAELGMLPADFSIDGLMWTPGPRPLPPWVLPGFVAAALVLLIAGAVTWRFIALNIRLSKEIDERTATALELGTARRNIAALLDATQSFAALIDHDGTILLINSAGAARFGGTPATIAGCNMYALSTMAAGDGRRAAVDQAIRERRIVIHDDERAGRRLHNTIVPVDGDDGRVHHVAVFSEDVTERKLAEEALRDANLKLQSQLDEIRALHATLEEMAVRDGLTGLYNRRYLDETLEREIARAKREGHSLALVMIDVDHFKRLNDTYGHQAGDQVLVAMGELLRADTRTEDVACRYGGEEFLVLLPHMSLEAARDRAETWRAHFAGLTVQHGELALQTTISLGVAAYPNHGHSAEELTQSADLALYLAKHDGRNRVTVFEATPLAVDV
ncbi:MAG: diguanylate cyclase [Rhodocyclaceae bacterium]|nr:diguanylate cyclase [Rhodocyclaceae bacterium]